MHWKAIVPHAVFPGGLLEPAEHVGYQAVAGLAGAMSVDRAADTSEAIWAKVAPRLSRHRRAARQLADAYPDSTAAWRAATLDGMWRNLGRTFAESFHLTELAADRSRFDAPSASRLREIFGGERRAVLASLHSGNWEVAVAPLLWHGYRTAGVYQRVKNQRVDAALRETRAPLYPAGLLQKGDQTVRQALRTVRDGGMVSVMADLRDRQGLAVPFFHRPAPSTPFPAFLARTLGVPLAAGRVIRLDGTRFAIEVEPIEVARTKDRADDLLVTTAALNACFERWVREHPDQWMWGHRRWGDTALRSERSSPYSAAGASS